MLLETSIARASPTVLSEAEPKRPQEQRVHLDHRGTAVRTRTHPRADARSALIALDATILATAVPSIVDDLEGLTEFPALLGVPARASGVSSGLRQARRHGGAQAGHPLRHRLFLIGSILCGFAWSMGSLIAMRALQGLGAGAVLPLTTTIAGDIYTVAERAKTQGYIASVWAVSSVVGPTLGGVFSQFASWRWIFFLNIPFCLLAAGMLWRNYNESVERRKHHIDYAGAIVLTVALTLLILAVLEGGRRGPGARGRASAPSLSEVHSSSPSPSSSVERQSRSRLSRSFEATHRRDLPHLDRRRRGARRPHLLRADLPRALQA